MGPADDHDLIPMGSAFDVVRRGYERAQVDDHLDRLSSDMHMLEADRDAAMGQAIELAGQLEQARRQIDVGNEQLNRLAQPPTTLEGLSERLQRMLRLAQDEASEVRARAETEAREITTAAESDVSDLRQRYEQMIADTEARRIDRENEHRDVMDTAHQRAEQIVAEARHRAERLAEESTGRLREVEEDFDITMAQRRTESMRALAAQEAASKAEATRRVEDATAEATRLVDEATAEARRLVHDAEQDATRRTDEATDRVERLTTLRRHVGEQLVAVRSQLDNAFEHLQRDDAEAGQTGHAENAPNRTAADRGRVAS